MALEVAKNIHRIELPLPRNPLRSVNSYVIKGDDRDLIIDTGMNRPECRDVLERELSLLEVDLSVSDVFVTHLHADHLGLAPHLTKGRTRVYLGAQDVEMMEEKAYWTMMLEYAMTNGFPDIDPDKAIRMHPGYKYGPLGKMDLVPVLGGELFEIGDYELRTIHTPGHTHGHMVLFDETKRILFSGDHILGDITPNISLWAEGEDLLSEYMGSLNLIRELDVGTTFPAHRSIILDHRKRIDELLDHHENRANEVISILGGRSMDAFTIASKMTWDLTFRSFEEFPIMQKWFALGEALAHIRYLETLGRITRKEDGDVIGYSIS